MDFVKSMENSNTQMNEMLNAMDDIKNHLMILVI